MDSKKHINKILEAIPAANQMLNMAVTPEVLEAMNEEQKAIFNEAKEAGSMKEIKAMTDKLEKLNKNYR